MTGSASVAMTAKTERELLGLVLREDGQEDLCLATYRPSTGVTRTTALISSVIPPRPGERHVHGNATITADYILRGASIATSEGAGLVLLHSHPGASRWQPMSGPDREAESSYATLARELTGHPLVGMTLAGGDGTWSARSWNISTGRNVDCTHAANVRVIGERLTISWNDALVPPHPPATIARSGPSALGGTAARPTSPAAESSSSARAASASTSPCGSPHPASDP